RVGIPWFIQNLRGLAVGAGPRHPDSGEPVPGRRAGFAVAFTADSECRRHAFPCQRSFPWFDTDAVQPWSAAESHDDPGAVRSDRGADSRPLLLPAAVDRPADLRLHDPLETTPASRHQQCRVAVSGAHAWRRAEQYTDC